MQAQLIAAAKEGTVKEVRRLIAAGFGVKVVWRVRGMARAVLAALRRCGVGQGVREWRGASPWLAGAAKVDLR